VPFSSKRITKLHQLTAAIALALTTGWASQADAAGLGRLTVQSGLGQPLRAEVEVTALAKDEVASLSAKLAPVEAFKQAGLEYNAALNSLRFAVDKRPDGRAIVRITSTLPVNEPFVDLLVELNWASGKFVREYTFLLDPPELKVAREPIAGSSPVAPLISANESPVNSPAIAAPSGSAPTVSLPPLAPVGAATSAAPVTPRAAATPRNAPTPKAEAKPVEAKAVEAKTTESKPEKVAKAAVEGDLKVKRGDTLAGIASRAKPSGVSLEQAIVAIYKANPEAFFGNVNRMKAGATLSIPEQTVMAAVEPAEARSQIRVRSGDFQRAKTMIAAKPRKLTAAKAGQSASGSVTAKVDEAASAGAKSDQLKLSKSNPSISDKGSSATGSKSATERAEAKVASSAASKEAQSRVADLEKNVASLQKLLDLKNKQLSELQKQVDDSKVAGSKSAVGTVGKSDALPPVAAVTPAVPKADVKPKIPDVVKVDPPKMDLPKPELPKVEIPKVADLPKPDLPKADLPKADVKVETPKMETPAVTPTDVATPPAIPPVAKTPAPADTIPPVPGSLSSKTTPAAETSIIDDVLENPLALGGLGGVALLGGGYALYAMRKRKKEVGDDKYPDSIIAGDNFSANSLFGSTGGQIVDTTTNNSVFATAVNANTESASTEVDPVAEAEVYIAYGREAQAEEILREALKKQPERQSARLKLLEILAAKKDIASFSAVSKEMYDQTGGHNEEWPKVITLGLSIDPNNSLYTGASPDSGFGTSALPNDDNPPTFMSELSDPASPTELAAARPSFAPTEPMKGAKSEFAGLDFDLGNDSSTIGRAADRLTGSAAVATAAVAATAVTAKSAGSGLQNAIGGSFELPSLDLSAPLSPKPTESLGNPLSDLGDFKIDLPSLEKLDSRMDAPAIDLSSIGLDLQSSGSGSSTAVANNPAPVDLSHADNAKWQEMATKLDLASAYEEIGDKEGAKELLNEVIKDGDPGQQQKARSMLSKI
jgi:pilus assembly protein FimV